MSKWNTGDKVLHIDSKQKGEVVATYATAHCIFYSNSGAGFTVKDKELNAIHGNSQSS